MSIPTEHEPTEDRGVEPTNYLSTKNPDKLRLKPLSKEKTKACACRAFNEVYANIFSINDLGTIKDWNKVANLLYAKLNKNTTSLFSRAFSS